MLPHNELSKMRIAIVHPWFITEGGGERVIDAIADVCPTADLFTLILDRSTLSPSLRHRNIQASFLSSIPMGGRFYQHLMPLYHLATTSFDLSGYDLVISSGGPATKGVIVGQGARHIHYCHSPVRFLWDQFPAWQKRLPAPLRPVFTLNAHHNREWDFNSAQRVDEFIANSNFVAQRIRTYYRRPSTIIYPPVDTSRGYVARERDDYFICVARLVPNKRIDLLIEACNSLRINLVIVGAGPERKSLEAAAGDTIRFLGRVGDTELSCLYAQARAFLFAAEEDFGIALVEAQSYGLPVIAYGGGGALETVIDASLHPYEAPTGVLYEEQTVECVCQAIDQFVALESHFDRQAIQNHARGFDTSIFLRRMLATIAEVMKHKSLPLMPREEGEQLVRPFGLPGTEANAHPPLHPMSSAFR
jgi:glycosyltransferase involved in cell wall biosynthesis